MKIRFKGNETKKRIDSEIQNTLEYMQSIGAGSEEYQDCLDQLDVLMKLKDEMSLTHRLKEALPWLSLAVGAVSTIAVPITLGTLAYRNSEEQGKLKNGDVWREAIQNQTRPQQPNITDNM